MNATAKVSVIMPTFNAEATLLVAVHSVLNQTVDSLELIICDDGSTDGTRAILDSIDDVRVKVLLNDHNRGAGPSRDRAIAAATAPWLAVIDADDAWVHNRLERLLRATANRDDVAVFDDLLMCHDAQGDLVAWKPLHGVRAFGAVGAVGVGPRDIEIEQYILSPRLLIKPLIPARAVKDYAVRHSSRRFGEDAEFFLRLAATGLKYRYLPEPLYCYRITPGSATAQAADRSLMRQCLEACADLDGWSPSVKRAFVRKIDRLRCNETLYAMAENFRRGKWIAAFKLAVANPGVLKVLPGRVIQQIRYQVHRIRHGGAAR